MTTAEAPANVPPPRAAARPVLVLVVVLVAVFVFWRFGPFADLRDPRRLAELGASLRARPDAAALVFAVYLAAALLFFPMMWLIAATALVFEPLRAFALGLTGALAAAAMTYGIGRVVGRARPSWVEGPRLLPVREKLQRRGVLAMAGARIFPVGNFSLINIVAGALGIRFRDYMLGNCLGLLPSLLLLTMLSERVRALGWWTP
jgi:uncharacterized membrane protein YdjX (TVP38/TMEM64 family)